MATAIAVPFAVFMVGICAAVNEATSRREQAQDLLEDLESANAELRANVARVRGLSVSEERARIARDPRLRRPPDRAAPERAEVQG